MQPVRLVGRVLAVALGERLEPLGVGVALARQLAAELGDVGLVAVGLGDLAERLGEVDLRAVQQAEVVGEVHGQPFRTRTAATLNIGCLETGSQR